MIAGSGQTEHHPVVSGVVVESVQDRQAEIGGVELLDRRKSVGGPRHANLCDRETHRPPIRVGWLS